MILKNSAELILSRRRAIGGLSALTTLAACGGGDNSLSSSSSASSSSSSSSAASSSSSSASSSSSSAASSSSSSSSTSITSCSATYPSACVISPCTTIGPYPLYTAGRPGSSSHLYRQDITTSTYSDGSTKETKSGVPLTVNIKVVDYSNGCTAMSGYNVYIWHCDASGNYSGYNSQAGSNYLRGYWTTDTDGVVTFTTIFPGCYSGRWPHIHCVVSISNTTDAVTQFAFPSAACTAAYNTSNYSSSKTTFNGGTVGWNSDGIFSGNSIYMANMCGDTSAYESFWTIGVNTSTICSDATAANASSTGQLASSASPW